MDSPSDLFQQQQQQPHPAFELYTRSPLESTSTGPSYPSSSPTTYPIISPLLHPNSAAQRWGGYRQRQCLFSKLPSCEDGREEDVEVLGRRAAEGASQGLLPRLGERRRVSVPESCDWSPDVVRAKRLRVDNVLRRDGETEREGQRGRRRIANQSLLEEKSREEEGRRKESREGRRRQRRELKLQLEETRGKLLELQRKVWQAYGEQRLEEEKEGGGGGVEEDGAMDEMAEVFSEGEGDDCPTSGPSPGVLSLERKHVNQNGNSDEFPKEPVDLDVDLDGGDVWLGCSLVQGEWENTSDNEKEKFAQALKQELANVVARVIDRVVRLYAESDHSPTPASVLAQETPARALGSNFGKKPRLGFGPNALLPGGAHVIEQAEALPLVSKKLQDKRNSISQGKQKHPLIPPQNPGLPFLPQPPLPALLPPRNKEPFLPSCPPNPPPLPLPLLHYTMQHLFTRSLSSIPLHKDGLSSEPFMEFRSHNPSFPPLPPLLAQLNPPLADRGRDEGMRTGGVGGMDGGDVGLYLGAGSSQEGLSPCHLKKAKLMFFYARYPSSNTLKTYFPDVKFNRCVTSQLIKWFSNFREFFYIQMERFARQAAREGLPASRDRALRLGRNSELFRILNMHYNKSNDYQVPDRFVEVSELALREFFTAIQSGRDADPCWKKSIYKIICKLDSPVPDSFRLPGCPMDTHRMV